MLVGRRSGTAAEGCRRCGVLGGRWRGWLVLFVLVVLGRRVVGEDEGLGGAGALGGGAADGDAADGVVADVVRSSA